MTRQELEAQRPAMLRVIAYRMGKPFPTPRTAAERRAVIEWILSQPARIDGHK